MLFNNLQVKGADHAVLDSYCRFLITAGKALDIDIGGRYDLTQWNPSWSEDISSYQDTTYGPSCIKVLFTFIG